MKFQLISDLHLEFMTDVTASDLFDTDTGANCLILAGDLGYPDSPTYQAFLEQVAAIYPDVIVICGNHEFYKSSINRAKEAITKIVEQIPNVHFLDDSVHEFKDQKIAVLGSTLWSSIEMKRFIAVQQYINDYRCIEELTPSGSHELHKKHVAWLQSELDCRTKHELEHREGWQVIVVTHHLPSLKLIHPKYEGSALNCAFASDLDHMMDPSIIKYWVSGHTHSSLDLSINGVRNLVNPRGYLTGKGLENKEFNPACCFDLM